jgi:hypothetical protein
MLEQYYSFAVPITLLGLVVFLFFANRNQKPKDKDNLSTPTPAEVNRARIKAEKLAKHLQNYPPK